MCDSIILIHCQITRKQQRTVGTTYVHLVVFERMHEIYGIQTSWQPADILEPLAWNLGIPSDTWD